ncbi:sugar lactone lactonase YvrE [Actinokineospora cianjurensis]|uniref:Sugar lactone lactonase YvrE n=1 Tax=Actinokineospora cianjurensis TaxID=585224 RepID=A0A421BBT9_9PSEU|nr:sugar lactone lactonase YvrE [Actinokineospora cianjurensis]
MTRWMRVVVGVLVVLAVGGGAVPASGSGDRGWPEELRLPDGFRPEGIAVGEWPVGYFGSLADGRVRQVDLRTGVGRQLSAPVGGSAVGLKVESGRHRLFVAGGSSGEIRVVDTRDGVVLAKYKVAGGFLNDVVVTRDAVWVTDSFLGQLYKVPLGRDGTLPAAAVTVPLGGEWVNTPNSFNANGIASTPDGRALIVGHTSSGKLFRVDPATGVAKAVDLGGESVVGNDGLLRLGRDLYVVENGSNRIAKVGLRPDGSAGVLERRLTDHRFDVATTVAAYGDRLYAVNARFSTPPTPTTTYTAVAVPRF